ncbi:MAG: hypothetical protein OES47_05880 [Acidobacteriota bacterium]|nr:hypothetical protein [Acidobacteriota bacterium]
MKSILNKTHRPQKIRLSQGKVLHLGPNKTGQIADHDAERESVKQMVEAGDLEIVGEGTQVSQAGGNTAPGRPDSHGHHPSVGGKNRGDR